MPKEVKALALSGMLGSGFVESSLKRALTWDPDFIGCDAGSTDGGATSLGTGECTYSRAAVKRDLRLALLGARQKRIPLLIGSGGYAGGDINLAWAVDIAKEIAREERLSFKLATIHSEQDKKYLKRKLAEGKITPLKPVLPFDASVIDRSEHIVGMMGAEPFIRALEGGAEVVIAGRSSDTSIFAAIPLQRGISPGPAWHAAKILECGAACVTHRTRGDCMFARIRQDHFIIEPPNPDYACSPASVAAHTFYETADPVHLYEPSGMVDTSTATYEAENDRVVRVTGSSFVHAEKYTIKLEGSEKVGYQTICVAGICDPWLLSQIDSWLSTLREKVKVRAAEVFGDKVANGGYIFNVRVYGRNGVMGHSEPMKDKASHEVGLVLEITAATQELANGLMSMITYLGLHQSVPQWKGQVSNFAFPYSPKDVARGALYRFNMNQVVEPADPYEMFPMEMVQI
jgi:hypothetical protein